MTEGIAQSDDLAAASGSDSDSLEQSDPSFDDRVSDEGLPRYKSKPANRSSRALKDTAGSDLLSHTVSHAVPSAESGLTSVFGMGTGVTLIL
jgi:hypothetical protein